MTLRGLVDHYGERVRAHPAQELLAGLGVAIGVALAFAVLVANGSITNNARTLVHGIAGSATLQLDARSGDGFPQALAERVRALPDVALASPLLEQRARVSGPSGGRSVDFVGVERSITALDGPVTRNLDPVLLVLVGDGMLLPSGVAREIGVPANGGAERRVTLDMRGRARRIGVAAVLGEAAIGPAADAALAIAPLARAQAIAGLPGRVTRILVTPKRGRDAAARAELKRLAGGRLTVAPVDREVALISQAAAPASQATGFFAAIAAICGTLLVFNAMLLTAPERRRSVAVLRAAAGYTPGDVAAMLLFEALALGVVGSAAGIALGILLAKTAFAGAPSFLSFAFALGGNVSIPLATALAVGAGGVLVTCVAAAPPLLDLRRGRALDAVEREQGEAGQRLPSGVRRGMAAAALAILALTALLVALEPAATVVAIGAVTVATALAIPTLCAGAARLAGWVAARADWHALDLAAEGVRARGVRASTLAAMAAVAVCGCLAIEGAHRDVLRGLDRNFAQYLASGDVWVTPGGAENSLTTESFPAAATVRRLAAVPGVAAVDPYYGSLLDVGDRRVWVIARGGRDAAPIPPSQLIAGDLRTATARLRGGSWVAVSNALAREQHAAVGGAFTLPTPAGSERYRVAAITTNLGWGPGAVVMSADRYRRDWLDPQPSALELRLTPGADRVATRRAAQAALGPGSELRAQTAPERDAQFRALARDGLVRLSQIALMLMAAAALSLAAGTVAAIWQRRVSLAVLRISGHLPGELWRVLLLEAAIVLGTGSLAGLVAGSVGHRLLARWLADTTGYPAPFALNVAQILVVLAGIVGAALALIALAGARAAHVEQRMAFHD
ncbi:MAG TPA: ABC transporter permease [Conexibacter sp.]|nr:ABC transporter permease [Conexibacter sp.]